MKNWSLLLVISFVLPGLYACSSQEPTTAQNQPVTAVPNEPEARVVQDASWGRDAASDEKSPGSQGPFVSDADFVSKAAQLGMAEVKLSQFMEKNAVDPAVKSFAANMVTEHSRANSLLMQLARENKWQTPETLDDQHQEVYNALLNRQSDDLDRLYMNQMLTDHQTAVALFEQASGKVASPQLKEYITQTLPALREHLRMAKEVHNALGKSK